MTETYEKAQEYISDLHINGLNGRMLYMPAKKDSQRQILFVYGHHASIERVFGFAEALHNYGNVTIPDMPGFGGMDSLYKIGKKPTIDALADYLAALIKLRFKKKPITIISVSLSFAVTTRMLQKYPQMNQQVELLVSAAGFVHNDDFVFTNRLKSRAKFGSRFFSLALPSFLTKIIFLKGPLIKWSYRFIENPSKKDSTESPKDRAKRWEFEVLLWRINDFRTHMFTINQMMSMNLCNQKVNLRVFHIAPDHDQYFNVHMIEQHMKIIYSDFTLLPVTAKVHAPSIIATAKDASIFLPPRLRRMLSKQPRK